MRKNTGKVREFCQSGKVGTLNIEYQGFDPHQCLLAGKWKKSARLPCWPPKGQTQEVNCGEHCRNLEKTKPEVQNMGSMWPTKRTKSSKFYFKRSKQSLWWLIPLVRILLQANCEQYLFHFEWLKFLQFWGK